MIFSKKIVFILFLFLTHSFSQAQSTDIKSFMFGHSLMDHRPPLIPTPSDETTIPHWIYLLATEAGNTYAATGQYGFLPQHQNLPPFAQWGYDIVPEAWDSDNDPFANADFNNVLITAGNFMQWQAPYLDYPSDPGVSPISATQTIVSWLTANEPDAKIYIYENWPDMAPYISGGSFPPSSSDLTNYYNYLDGDFHDWWLEYHDSLLLSHPVENVRMIPVGPVLSELLTNTVLNTIPATELYEDNAPHGRATLYFLAGMVTYMAIYEEKAPASYSVPSIVHSTVASNYSTVVDLIWDELLAFNLSNGNSRVFFNSLPLPVELVNFNARKNENGILLNWKTAGEISNEKFEIEYSQDGILFGKIGEVLGNQTTSETQVYSFLHNYISTGWNYYRLKQIDFDGKFEYSSIVSVEVKEALNFSINFFPNPSHTGFVNLNYLSSDHSTLQIEVHDITGRFLRREMRLISEGQNQLKFDFSNLGKGIFVVKIKQDQNQIFHKLIIE